MLSSYLVSAKHDPTNLFLSIERFLFHAALAAEGPASIILIPVELHVSYQFGIQLFAGNFKCQLKLVASTINRHSPSRR